RQAWEQRHNVRRRTRIRPSLPRLARRFVRDPMLSPSPAFRLPWPPRAAYGSRGRARLHTTVMSRETLGSRAIHAPTEAEAPYYRTDGPYIGNQPHFYDVERFLAALRVRERWRMIRDEYAENVARGADHVVDVFNPTGPKIPGWRSVNFQTYLWRYHG